MPTLDNLYVFSFKLNNRSNLTMSQPSLAMRLISAWTAGSHLPSRIGLLRSTLIYYGVPRRRERLARFYSQFMGPGDIVYDVGAHVGNRVQAWRDIGAKVVAFEPQPTCMTLLRKWYGSDANVTLVDAALGSERGEEVLYISSKTPTVTTLSQDWQEEVQQAESFADVSWERQLSVSVSTLNDQIALYGLPTFCKIDVEGYELEVLQGLSQPLPALSVEYIPAAPSATQACINRLMQLGPYQFNWSVGESHRLQSNRWLSAADIGTVISGMGTNDDSGDLYARV